jgi:ribosomal protein L11 methyltransferase
MIKLYFPIPSTWEEPLFAFCETVLQATPFLEDMGKGPWLNLLFETEKEKENAIFELRSFWKSLNTEWETDYPFHPEITFVDADWRTRWQAFFRVIHVTPRLTIKPEWEEYHPRNSREVELIIRPKNAFGTGFSDTTQIALRLLERVVFPGCRILDVGTGSGILAMAAEKLGAGRVDALDNDPDVFENIGEHLCLNTCSKIHPIHIGFEEFTPDKPYDLVVSNLILSQLTCLGPHVAGFLCPLGRWIVSGILAEQEGHFLQMAVQYGFSRVDWEGSAEWVGGILQRESRNPK